MSQSTLKSVKTKPTTWYFVSLKHIISYVKECHAVTPKVVAASALHVFISLTFPTPNAPFEMANTRTVSNVRKCLRFVLERKLL